MQTFLPRWRTLCKDRDRYRDRSRDRDRDRVGDLLHIYSRNGNNDLRVNLPTEAQQTRQTGNLQLFMHFVQASATNLIVVI